MELVADAEKLVRRAMDRHSERAGAPKIAFSAHEIADRVSDAIENINVICDTQADILDVRAAFEDELVLEFSRSPPAPTAVAQVSAVTHRVRNAMMLRSMGRASAKHRHTDGTIALPDTTEVASQAFPLRSLAVARAQLSARPSDVKTALDQTQSMRVRVDQPLIRPAGRPPAWSRVNQRMGELDHHL
tara:strand:+ start:4720 stop:5283 length:564 start_codon:yes stop_codon:yes gene_type:complete